MKKRKKTMSVFTGELSGKEIPGGFTSHILPDASGSLLQASINDEWLLHNPAKTVACDWKSVAIVSLDFLFTAAIRWLLGPLSPVRLRVFNQPGELQRALDEEKAFRPDVIIWRDLASPPHNSIVGHVIQLCRKFPDLQQLVISDLIPTSMSILPRGVSVISPQAHSSEINRALRICMIEKWAEKRLFNRPVMTRTQWRSIKLHIAGYSIEEIAHRMILSTKRIYGLHSEVMKNLNLRGPAHKAWLYRSIQEIIIILPRAERQDKVVL